MKKEKTVLLIFFTILLLSVNQLLFTAEFAVQSFTIDPSDITAIQQKVTDDNGDRTGIIKIQSDQTQGMMVFANLGVVKVDKSHPGEFWLYLSPSEKRLKISKNGFLPLDYILPERIESDNVYILTLKTIGLTNYSNIIDNNLYRITFRFNESSVYIAKDNSAPVKVQGKVAVFKLPHGKSIDFKFLKEGFFDIERKITVDKDKIISLNLIKGNNSTKLKLPGVITINSTPEEGEIYLNNQKFSITPFQDQLIAGDYDLSIRKDFFSTYNTKFTIEEGETKELPIIRLNPQFAEFAISKEDIIPNDAKIYIDGILLGTPPIDKTKIEVGDHIFKATHLLFHSEEQKIIFNNGDDKNIKFNLKQNYGSLSITSEPENSIVLINNIKVGTTPYVNNRMQPGQYKVSLTKKLWSDINEVVTVEVSKQTEKLFVLNKNFGVVEIVSDGNSEIYINDEKLGKGKIISKNLKPGTYTIVAKKNAHEIDKKIISVKIGKTQEIKLIPKPIMSSLTILSSPLKAKGAEILLDGKNIGKYTPTVMPLMIGEYNITLKHPNFLEASKKITITEGKNEKLNFILKKYVGTKKSNISFWNTQKWIALSSFVVCTGVGSYFYYSGNKNYADYENTSVPNDATIFFDDAKRADSYRDISFTVSLVPLGYFVYSWYKESSYK